MSLLQVDQTLLESREELRRQIGTPSLQTMAENTGIRWDPNLQQARRATESAPALDPITSAQVYQAVPDSARSDGDDILTQRNTPTALSAQRAVDPIDEALCVDLDSISQQDNASPAFAPLRSQQSLPSSAPNSSQSLKALSERDADISGNFVSRALSAKSSQGQIRGRRTSSHSKSASISTTKRSILDRPAYPDQSFAALQSQFYNARPHPPLRARSSHPAQNLLYNDMSNWISQSNHRGSVTQGTKTADNTPMSSPGLFSPSARLPSASSLDDIGPQLHHLQAPKETDFAEIEHDTFSGNKFINNYEVVQELGRGEHGKVKLGRNIETAAMVAIKIVPRYSVKRRLGRLGAPEDRTKREVAILKKARHPNVVSLLEVIDDPNKNKVYLILEYVEKGEIKWRKPGVREVLSVKNARFDQERRGATLSIEPSERDVFHVTQAQRRHEQMDRDRARNADFHPVPNWSLEHGGELEDDEHFLEMTRTPSQQFYGSSSNTGPSRTTSHDDHANNGDTALMGSMWGAYDSSDYRDRKFSIAASAASHMSSEFNFEANDELSYVPAMTLEEARRAIRDTLSGLQFLHFIGIIHRDIKPANLLVGSSGTVKISDFGVSYLGRPITDKDPENHLTEKDVASLDDEKDLARSVGTPAFWAPELCYEEVSMFADNAAPKITGALDLWALGITLYCMVYARLPFYASEGMGLHAAICTTEVFLPKTRLVPVDTSKDRPSSHVPTSINSNKRLDFELKFEEVPEAVRDLIRCLLVKDPAKRMTIDQAKQHTWVTEGMQDPDSWIQNTGLEKERKKKILEVDEKEVSHAVVKRNIIERALNTAGRIAGSLLGRSNTRKRAPSAATSTSHSSDSLASPSSGSTVGRFEKEKMREARRSSLRGDEVLTALKTSRENTEHPLAQSETASPFDHPHEYFSESLSGQKAASTGCSPMVERELRPQAPERGISNFSNAESVKTIRASQMHRLPLPLPDILQEPDRSVSQERGVRARVDGIWEGTKSLVRIGSRDRRTKSDRSPVSSRNSSECDIQAARGGPSLAISTASAAGAFEPPDALRTTMSPVNYNTSPPAPPSITNTPHKTSFQAPTSTPEAFEQAQEVNQRRLILEAHYQAEAEAEAATRSLSQVSFDDECPPSPDDITFLKKQQTKAAADPPELSIESVPIQAGPSASTIASSTDGYGASSVSQSMSVPSFGIVSSASSPPGEGFLGPETTEPPLDLPLVAKETEPSFMRTADTVTKHGRPMQVATGAALEDRQGLAYDDGDCDGDDDDDSEEEGMMMGLSRKKG